MHPQAIKDEAGTKKDVIEILKDAKAFCSVEEEHVGDEAGHNGYGNGHFNAIFFAFKNAVDAHLKDEKAALKLLEDEAKQCALMKTMKKFNKDLGLGVRKLEDEVKDVGEESEAEDDDMS